MSAPHKPGQKLTFTSTLQNWAQGMDYCALAVPADITEALGTRRAVLVMARLNDSAPFRVSLFPAGGGRHFIRVRKKVRRDAGLSEGDRVRVAVTILDRADIEIPRDLSAALRAKKALARFNALTAGRRNYLIRRIDEAAMPQTRARRVREVVDAACAPAKKPGR